MNSSGTKGPRPTRSRRLRCVLEQARLDINAFNDNGDTAVHRASGERIIRFRWQTAQNWTCTTKQRKTPLDVALERKDRNGAIRHPGAVAALRELTAALVGLRRVSPQPIEARRPDSRRRPVDRRRYFLDNFAAGTA